MELKSNRSSGENDQPPADENRRNCMANFVHKDDKEQAHKPRGETYQWCQNSLRRCL